MSNYSNDLIEHLFRTEAGKLVSALTRIFGTSNIQMAEDIVQDTLITALDHWSTGVIPSNPEGWLFQVAKRKALNEIKKRKVRSKHHTNIELDKEYNTSLDIAFLDREIHDNQLRMIFTCCHPSINVESQIALTLKTLCGFGISEVASALLTSEDTINKRLYRAKKKIRESNSPFEIPDDSELLKRINTVALTLYLLYNEGYNSTSGNSPIRKDLCLEALRLTKLLADHFKTDKRLHALLSLMCFHSARFDARLDDNGAIILFKDQNRGLWNKDLINLGMQYLEKSLHDDELSAYHIEACIGAEHCMASSFENTNWQAIYDLYLLLEQIKSNPVIKLNLAIIESELKGLDNSLETLNKLSDDNILKNYYLLPATQGTLLMRKNDYKTALKHLTLALSLNPSKAEKKLIESSIEECKKILSGLA